MGLIALRQGRHSRAGRHLEKTLKAIPQHIDALVALGTSQVQMSMPERAVAQFEKALALDGNHPRARLNLGNALSELNRTDEAIRHLEILCNAHPREPSGHFHLALAYAAASRLPEAIECYQMAIELAPDYADAHCNLSLMLASKGDFEAACRHIETAISVRPNDAPLLKNLADVYIELERFDEARKVCEILLVADPTDRDAIRRIAWGYHVVGDFGAAKTFLDGKLELMSDPADIALLKYTRLKNDRSISEGDVAWLEKQAGNQNQSEHQRAMISLALGDHYHRHGAYPVAFQHYRNMNEIKAQGAAYDPEKFDAYIDGIIETFTPELFERFSAFANPSQCPIIIAGMPRSGTTLTEQILASHSAVAGGGELPYLHYALSQELPYRTGRLAEFPKCFFDISAELADELTEGYLDRLETIAPAADRVVDKEILSWTHLGAIAILLPNAKIIHCRREPRASALSIYFHAFAGQHPYCWDLYNIGRRYRSYLRLMAHWRQAIVSPDYELQYEDLVADQERLSRELIEFCGLPWEDAVLRFEETERSVRTASSRQVRQALYSDAVEGWRRYEEYLGPLEDGLAGRARTCN